MANKVVSFLETIGKDIEKGFEKVAPFLEIFGQTILPIMAPQLQPVFQTSLATAIMIEQKFAAMGQQSGTGVQKLAEATTILAPVVAPALKAIGAEWDSAGVQAYINGIVAFLNAIPTGIVISPLTPQQQMANATATLAAVTIGK